MTSTFHPPQAVGGNHPSATPSRPPSSIPRAGEIIDFAVRWRHWGGGDGSEIFIEFGLTVAEFFKRLETLLNAGHYSHDPQIRSELVRLCRKRLRGRNTVTRGSA